jgi:hypothetical protein
LSVIAPARIRIGAECAVSAAFSFKHLPRFMTPGRRNRPPVAGLIPHAAEIFSASPVDRIVSVLPARFGHHASSQKNPAILTALGFARQGPAA